MNHCIDPDLTKELERLLDQFLPGRPEFQDLLSV